MTVQPTRVLPQNSIQAIEKELILLGLMQTEQLGYFSLVGGRHGFVATSRWNTTIESIRNTLDNPTQGNKHATLQALKAITIKIITGANHYYAIDEIATGSETRKLSNLITLMSEPGRENEFSKVFPSRLTEENGLPAYAGHHLAAVEKLSDGIALIYAHVQIKKIPKGKYAGETYSEQYFNTVFIPNTLSRIEYRIDRKLGSRAAAKAMEEIRYEFLALLNLKDINLQLTSVNFYKAINNAYQDKNYGRVVQADAVNAINDEDANFRCRSGKKYDARYRKIVRTETGTDVDMPIEFYCVCVRFDYTTGSEEHFNEIGFETTRQNYMNKQFCGSFFMTQQSDNVPHMGVIDDILKRAR
ncbi:hypothetical protein [Citrobacter sp. R-1.5.2]|uniref:hypothetical protein n=1 Tax=Citrobacter sp. R-1.5.2 TaxID=3046183 RepID=UPI002B24CB07|nr:hypothetical protein [Citrobacter sp. R-1.5.2]MEB2419512.1 hypothetical protein [Citrobacter sp. R-1.5.2]